MALARGRLAEAAQAYGDSLAISKKLAAADPSNTQWQSDLSVSYWRLANLAERQQKVSEAQSYLKQALDVLSALDQKGVYLSPRDLPLLKILRHKADGTGR